MPFTFKTVLANQRDMITAWLEQDYIREWVHSQGLINLFNGLDKFIAYKEQGGDINRQSSLTQHWIGYDDGKPFVYLLTSNVDKNSGDVYALQCEQAGHAITLDIFIGDPTYVGKGLSTQIIKTFLLTHFKDVSEVLIDPEQTNLRAVHVYQKAGFVIKTAFLAPWNPVPHHLMKLNISDLE